MGFAAERISTEDFTAKHGIEVSPALQPKADKQTGQILAFNGPVVKRAAIHRARFDRNFEVVEAFVAVNYRLRRDTVEQTRLVLASVRVDKDRKRGDLRKELETQAIDFFKVMVHSGRESMFPTLNS